MSCGTSCWLGRRPTTTEADYYLFVDSDIDFETEAAPQIMLGELEAAPEQWAVQARFSWNEGQEPGSSLDIWAGRPFEVTLSPWGWEESQRAPIKGTVHARCHPGATLVRNSPLFQELVRRVGFASMVVIAGDTEIGGFHDTLGMVSTVMAAAGYRYGLSKVMVHHFFMASYDQVHVVAREVDARRRLERFADPVAEAKPSAQ